MIKHTPGPWRTISDGYISSDTGFLPIVTPFVRRANRDKHGNPSPEAKANARLIAAAPDLIDALEDCIEDLQDWADDNEEPGEPYLATEAAMAKGRAAIAKAGTS